MARFCLFNRCEDQPDHLSANFTSLLIQVARQSNEQRITKLILLYFRAKDVLHFFIQHYPISFHFL